MGLAGDGRSVEGDADRDHPAVEAVAGLHIVLRRRQVVEQDGGIMALGGLENLRRGHVLAIGAEGAVGSLEIGPGQRSEEHTSELQSLMRRSYAVFCLKKKKKKPMCS